MDKGKIIKEKFYPIFCEINSKQKRYAEVWLTLWTKDVYELKVKMFPGVKQNSNEIGEIIDLLHEKAKEEFKPIWAVKIIDADEYKKRCKKRDVMVYCEAD